METIDLEWRLFRNDPVLNEYEGDIIDFWKKVEYIYNPDGSLKYGHLLKLAKAALILPNSSAASERLFSQVNLNKTKSRNKLNTDSLSGILYSKTLLQNTHCFDFDINSDLLKKHNSKNMYGNLE